MLNKLPVRKNTRLMDYDYSSAGYYYITICVKDGREMLGRIVVAGRCGQRPLQQTGNIVVGNAVVGNAVVGNAVHSVPQTPQTILSEHGNIVQRILENGGNPLVKLDKYIIMPNHIHLILVVLPRMEHAAIPSNSKSLVPTFVRSLKTMATKQIGISIWQKSFHDRIIRNEEEYQHIWRYIDENPARWVAKRMGCCGQAGRCGLPWGTPTTNRKYCRRERCPQRSACIGCHEARVAVDSDPYNVAAVKWHCYSDLHFLVY